MKHAFLVGINKFRGGDIEGQDLNGCVNDIAGKDQTRDQLVHRYGFDDVNIHMLTDERAKKDAIWAQLESYVHTLKAGDQLVWWQSCHGTRFAQGGKMIDALCATDFTWDKPVLTGPALKTLFKGFRPGVEVVCAFDACHSGDTFRNLRPPPTGTALSMKGLRDAQAKYPGQLLMGATHASLGGSYGKGVQLPYERKARYVRPPEDLLHDFRKVRADRGLGQNPTPGETPPGVLFYSGCDFDETSADAFEAGDYHGAFTFFFWKAVAAGGPTMTFIEALTEARKLLKAADYQQHPGLEGDPGATKKAFLGGLVKREEPPAPVQPTEPSSTKVNGGNFFDGYDAEDLPDSWV